MTARVTDRSCVAARFVFGKHDTDKLFSSLFAPFIVVHRCPQRAAHFLGSSKSELALQLCVSWLTPFLRSQTRTNHLEYDIVYAMSFVSERVPATCF